MAQQSSVESESRKTAVSSSFERSDAGLCATLQARGRLSAENYNRAHLVREKTGGALPAILIQLGLTAERDIAEAYGDLLGIPVAGESVVPPEPLVVDHLLPAFLRTIQSLPVYGDDDRLGLAMVDPLDDDAVRAVSLSTGKKIERLAIAPSLFQAAFGKLYEAPAEDREHALATTGAPDEADLERLRDMASDAPVVRFVSQVIEMAVSIGASDVHIEPGESALRLRFRIDGALQDRDAPPVDVGRGAVSRIKVLADLNIAENRLPQDGRILTVVQGRRVDIRVSTLPTLHGESVVMRILDRDQVPLDLSELGFEPEAAKQLNDLVDRPNGIVLVTGPTGSGKTTTLYAALARLNRAETKIVTVEDPVEYELSGINQLQVRPQIGLTFAAALRAILRQDPDIILIGEMRDLETAQIGIQASLTGHLVLATLHTNSAVASIVRLLEMGVEEYLIAATLTGIVSQRLVRTLCPDCRMSGEPPRTVQAQIDEVLAVDLSEAAYCRPVGCPACNGTGFRGRTCLTEIMPMGERLHRLILERAPLAEFQAEADRQNIETLYQSGLRRVASGDTTIEEVARVTRLAG